MVPMCNLRCQTRVISGIKVYAVGQKNTIMYSLNTRNQTFLL